MENDVSRYLKNKYFKPFISVEALKGRSWTWTGQQITVIEAGETDNIYIYIYI